MIKKPSLITVLTVIALLVFMLALPELAREGALEGLRLCSEIIVPSLLPFMILSSLIIHSGAAGFLSALLRKPVTRLFRLPPQCGTPFIVGILAGFPVGAKSAVELYQNKMITKDECARTLAFCNNTGPAFVIGVIGAALWNSVRVGVILYVSQILSAVLTGFLLSRRYPKRPPERSCLLYGKVSFSSVVSETAEALLNICVLIIFFSVVIKFLTFTSAVFFSSFIKNRNLVLFLSAVLSSIIEITNAVSAASGMASFTSVGALVITAFAVGWSGISVHMQVAQLNMSHGIPLKPYIAGKFFQGAVTALLCYFIFGFLYKKPDVAVFSTSYPPYTYNAEQNAFFMLMLILMLAFLFLFCVLVFVLAYVMKKMKREQR